MRTMTTVAIVFHPSVVRGLEYYTGPVLKLNCCWKPRTRRAARCGSVRSAGPWGSMDGLPKIKVVWDSAIDEIRGNEGPAKVTHVRLKNVKSGALTELSADGVFIAIGHAPATDLVAGQIKLKPSGYVEVAPNSTATSVPGLFAAGDVADETYRQAVTAAGLGCMAALEAERFLALRANDRAAAE